MESTTSSSNFITVRLISFIPQRLNDELVISRREHALLCSPSYITSSHLTVSLSPVFSKTYSVFFQRRKTCCFYVSSNDMPNKQETQHAIKGYQNDYFTWADWTFKTVLNLLKAIYLRLRKTVVKRVTVVKFGVDNRGSDGTGCFRIKVRTDAAEFTDMRIAGLRKWWDLIGEGKMSIKNKT